MKRRAMQTGVTGILSLCLALAFSATSFALGNVTVSGVASVDYAAPSELSVCYKNVYDALDQGCAVTQSNGSYTLQLDTSKSYVLTLHGRLSPPNYPSESEFISSDVQLSNLQASGTLDLQLQTEEITTNPIRDQFGDIVTNAPSTIGDSGYQVGLTNVVLGSNSVGASLALWTDVADTYTSGSTLSDNAGMAHFRVAKFSRYVISAKGQAGTNLGNRGLGACMALAPSYSPCDIVVSYPRWDVTIPGVNQGPYYYWTNGLIRFDWAPYPYEPVAYYELRNGNYYSNLIATVFGQSYTYPTLMPEGGYGGSLIAYDANNNIIAITGDPALSKTVDYTAPVASGLTMSKTAINKRTGPVTITLASATDNFALNRAEYFVDVDPGAGNGQNLSSNSSGGYTVSTDLSTLPAGSHTLYVRVADMAYNWSNTLSVPFTVK